MQRPLTPVSARQVLAQAPAIGWATMRQWLPEPEKSTAAIHVLQAVNDLGTQHLASAARAASVKRFIFTSSFHRATETISRPLCAGTLLGRAASQ